MKQILDNFSQQAATYAQFRPTYPRELYDYIFQHINSFENAWDCATGNGQVAVMLAKRFNNVYARDISEKQLLQAPKKENIFYKVERAEQTDFADNFFDLITIAQALHWFDFNAFYAEVKRVGKNNSIIAAWAYDLLKIEPAIDKILGEFYYEKTGPYWDNARKYVDEQYQTIPFPFEKIIMPEFSITTAWTLQQLEGYLNSWSAVQHFIKKEGYNPVGSCIATIAPLWKDEEKPVHFPVTLLMGRIIK